MDLVALKVRKLEFARKSGSSLASAIGFMPGIAQIFGDFNYFASHVIRVKKTCGLPVELVKTPLYSHLICNRLSMRVSWLATKK
jgi:hypothetical protein